MQRTISRHICTQVAAWCLLAAMILAAASPGETQSADSSSSAQSQSEASSGASSSNGLFGDLSAGGSFGSSAGVSGSTSGSANLQNQLQQMVQFGMRPVSSTMKFFAPNTYQGAQADLNNGFYTLSNGLANGVSGVVGSYQSLQNEVMSRLSNQLQTQQELLVRLYQLVSNPERMCQQLASSSKSVAEQASSQAQQAASDAGSSFVRRFSFGPFG